jgi:dihydroorotase
VVSVNLTDVRLVLGEELVEGGISIRNGRIAKVSRTSGLPKAERTISGKGLIAIPGLIDVHVHLRDMELSYKEDFSSGTLAAAAGGFTTVLDMPNTKPPTNSSERLREKIEKARNTINVDVGFYASLSESAVDLHEMTTAGAIAFKLYMNNPEPNAWYRDRKKLLSAMEECRKLGILVAVHAEDGPAIARIQTKCIESGKNSMRDFLRAHSPEFEVQSVRVITDLACRSRSRVHIAHVSTHGSLKEIGAARRRGARITCEVTPHHLLLSSTDLKRKRGFALMVPPLRRQNDARALWKAMLAGEIDMIASDHAPHGLKEKIAENVWEVKPGSPGLETTLSLLLTKVHRNEITLAKIVRVLSENPAKTFGLRSKGQLRAGADGDLVLIDPKARFKIDSSKFYSKAHFSPFNGITCVGRPVMTLVGGHVVYDHGEITDRNQGEILARGRGT